MKGLIGFLFVDCADTGIIRTSERTELLYTRSQVVVAAKAYGLEAIDMVRRSNELRFGV